MLALVASAQPVSGARRLLLAATGSGGSFVLADPDDTGPWYGLYNGTDTSGTYQIGAFSSVDGSTLTKYASNPVLSPTSGWESSSVKDPWLIWDGSQYVMYYSGYNGTTFNIGRATAPAYTGSYTRYGSNPVLSPGSSGAFDDQHVAYPVVLYEPTDTGREWKMWYSGIKASDGKVRVGYAYSSDGLSWTKVGMVVDVGGVGTWNHDTVGPATVRKIGSTYYLFINGWLGTQKQAGLVTFTDPEGTYTPDAGNPLIVTRVTQVGGSAISPPLSANASAGTAVIHVTSVGSLQVGEPVVIVDSNSLLESHIIASIDSGTQLTLRTNIADAMTTANGAVIRSAMAHGIGPRTMRKIGGVWVAFAAYFQPADDLSFSGGALREGPIRLTSSGGLAGAWDYDYTASQLFGLYPDNSTSWDSRSIENMSVIPAP